MADIPARADKVHIPGVTMTSGVKEVVNLTPHEVRVIREGSDDVVFPPSGDLARLGTIDLGTWEMFEGVLIEGVEFGHLADPPAKVPGRCYIVSLPCGLASPRDDFLVPYEEVRDAGGRIVGCRMLARPV